MPGSDMPGNDKTDEYQPIACSFHDRLEAAAVTRTECELVYRGSDGTQATEVLRIADVFSRDGAEYITNDAGEQIRLDRIISLDGVALPPD